MAACCPVVKGVPGRRPDRIAGSLAETYAPVLPSAVAGGRPDCQGARGSVRQTTLTCTTWPPGSSVP